MSFGPFLDHFRGMICPEKVSLGKIIFKGKKGVFCMDKKNHKKARLGKIFAWLFYSPFILPTMKPLD